MAQKTIAEMSAERLNKNKSAYKGILIAFGISWCVAIGILIYVWLNKPDRISKVAPGLIAVFTAGIPAMLLVFKQLGAVNQELKKRTATIR